MGALFLYDAVGKLTWGKHRARRPEKNTLDEKDKVRSQGWLETRPAGTDLENLEVFGQNANIQGKETRSQLQWGVWGCSQYRLNTAMCSTVCCSRRNRIFIPIAAGRFNWVLSWAMGGMPQWNETQNKCVLMGMRRGMIKGNYTKAFSITRKSWSR